MKTMKFLKREAINLLLIVLPVIYIFIVHNKLPRFEIFSLNGGQNIYRLVSILLAVTLAWYIMYLNNPSIYAKTSLNPNTKSFKKVNTLIILWISFLCCSFISEAIGIDFNWRKITFIAAMLFMMVMGNLYPTLRYNYFIGLKNKWARSSVNNWKKSHKFAGKIFFWGGLAGAVYGIFFNVNPLPYMPVIMLAYVFGLGFTALLYSFFTYKKSIEYKQKEYIGDEL